MTNTNQATLSIIGFPLRETAKAILLRSSASDCWLPKSQIEKIGDIGTVAGTNFIYKVPVWLIKVNSLEQAIFIGE